MCLRRECGCAVELRVVCAVNARECVMCAPAVELRVCGTLWPTCIPVLIIKWINVKC